MSIDPNWNRWIYASVAKHFKDGSDTAGIHLFLEGEDRDTAELEDLFEFRMNGPVYKIISKTEYRLDICLNILITTKRNATDFFKHITITGIATQLFSQSIPVYKMGSETGDDPNILFDCLQLYNVGDRTVITEQIGQISCEILAVQAAVEGCYRMYLSF